MTEDTPDTHALLERIRRGERQAVNALLERHRALLRRFLDLRLDPALRRRVDPSDIVQEAQLIVARRLEDFLARRPMPFHVWLRKTAYETLITLRRKHSGAECRSVAREQSLDESSSILLAERLLGGVGQLQRLVDRELTERVRLAVTILPEIDQEILLLRAYEGLENAEAAAVLDLDPKTASKRYAPRPAAPARGPQGGGATRRNVTPGAVDPARRPQVST